VKVFTVRNLSKFRRSEIFREYFNNNFHGGPNNVYVIVRVICEDLRQCVIESMITAFTGNYYKDV
jgi:hypothetical protein